VKKQTNKQNKHSVNKEVASNQTPVKKPLAPVKEGSKKRKEKTLETGGELSRCVALSSRPSGPCAVKTTKVNRLEMPSETGSISDKIFLLAISWTLP